ncbi:MAG: hypothetical protein V7720_17770 [Halioglobus sp.]
MGDPLNSVFGVTRLNGKPTDVLPSWLDNTADAGILVLDFQLQQWWLDTAGKLPLTAIYCLENDKLLCAVTDQTIAMPVSVPHGDFRKWAAHHELAVFAHDQPLGLQATYIAKPWGQEVWFTGVEERGVCCFTDGQNSSPIPWVQAIMPNNLAGATGTPLVLLKILDPAPEEVTGDLYFELHQEKREVYVVTHVDRQAWPDGKGGIRYGFDPQRLAEAGTDEGFKQSYLAAVREYESVRREIDDLPAGTGIQESLLQRELLLRQAMNDFTYMRPLAVGDVVVVPLLMPHSLQHGVRTIEFQTPVYERQILSFAQKVLTQNHWDTDTAVKEMRLTPPAQKSFALLQDDFGLKVERIVDFIDFEVCRVTISDGASLQIDTSACYQLLMVVTGELPLDERILTAEQAALLPAGQSFCLRSCDPAESLVLLLSLPCI